MQCLCCGHRFDTGCLFGLVAACAENNLTVCFVTNSKLNSDLDLTLAVTGLKGNNTRTGEYVPVKGPESGDMHVQTLNRSDVPDAFNATGTWNRTRGDLKVKFAEDTQPNQMYCFR